MKKLTLAQVDDHVLFRKGLRNLIEAINPKWKVILEADNGADFQKKLKPNAFPDLVLMDINMPGMNGFESVQWLKQHFVQVPVLVVSMIEQEEAVVKMVKLGVKGYISKDVEPAELKAAIETVAAGNFYYTDYVSRKLVHSLQQEQNTEEPALVEELKERELQFLKLACTDLTYQDIAKQMALSPKTIDGYRGVLFDKLKVKSRVGLAVYAIKNQLVDI